MTLTNPYASVFPYVVNPSIDFSIESGLSKREIYALAAMHALIIAQALVDIEPHQPTHLIAAVAVDQADALIGELNELEEELNRSQAGPEQG